MRPFARARIVARPAPPRREVDSCWRSARAAFDSNVALTGGKTFPRKWRNRAAGCSPTHVTPRRSVAPCSASSLRLAALLPSGGLPVATFASGEESLSSRSLEASGCLILDLLLPGMGGRSNSWPTRVTGFIVRTAYGDDDAPIRTLRVARWRSCGSPVRRRRLAQRGAVGAGNTTAQAIARGRGQAMSAEHCVATNGNRPYPLAHRSAEGAWDCRIAPALDHRRDGDGEGTRRPGDPPARPVRFASVRRDQLRLSRRHVARSRALRP